MNRTIHAAAVLAALFLGSCRETESVSKMAEPHAGHAEATPMWHCPMHPTVIRDQAAKCPLCGMDLVPFAPEPADSTSVAPHADSGAGTIVRLDAATIQSTGVVIETVGRRSLAATLRASARVEADESRYASVPLRTMGYVERLAADRKGLRVRRGQTLATVYSPDVAVAQDEFLRVGGELREAARRRLANWDVDPDLIGRLEKDGKPSRTFSVKSPVDGVVMEKMVVQGQTVMPGMEMFRILDLSRVWIVAQVPQGDLARIRIGSAASVRVAGLPGRTFQGRATWIAPELDMETRTAQVRVEVANTRHFDLRLGMVADVEFASGEESDAVAVPRQALIPTGSRTIALVALGGGRFQPREVRTGVSAGGWVQILSGLEEGERIVTSAQFLLDSESNLRAALESMTSSDASHDHDGTGN